MVQPKTPAGREEREVREAGAPRPPNRFMCAFPDGRTFGRRPVTVRSRMPSSVTRGTWRRPS
jgi:hypothetical protein